MDQNTLTVAAALRSSAEFKNAKEALRAVIAQHCAKLTGVTPPRSDEMAQSYEQAVSKYGELRGRPLYFPCIVSGIGNGALVELCDGSVKYDMISGIGINFFGHSHPELIDEALTALASDLVQGNLEPGFEAHELLTALLARVGKESRLKHGWLTTCGTMANEIALKIIRQKKFPASKILAFEDCFAGRSTAMQEITDNAAYREGQPLYGEALVLPFYREELGLTPSMEHTVSRIKEYHHRYPGRICGLVTELVQGEGGFRTAPREFFVKVFETVKECGMAVWVDEIQTFGRTGELFAYQKLGLEKHVDVVTLAKALQTAATLYTDEFNPKPGLIAGTFLGWSAALRAGKRILDTLDSGMLGENGHITKLSKYFDKKLAALAEGSCKGLMGSRRILGGMIAFEVYDNSLAKTKEYLNKLYKNGVIAFYCGHGPHFVRMLPPLPVMNEHDVDSVTAIVEDTLLA